MLGTGVLLITWRFCIVPTVLLWCAKIQFCVLLTWPLSHKKKWMRNLLVMVKSRVPSKVPYVWFLDDDKCFLRGFIRQAVCLSRIILLVLLACIWEVDVGDRWFVCDQWSWCLFRSHLACHMCTCCWLRCHNWCWSWSFPDHRVGPMLVWSVWSWFEEQQYCIFDPV